MTITLIIIAITCLVSFPAFSNEEVKDNLLFWPYEVQRRNQYYRFFTGGLVHADTMHLLFNMITLYSFGEVIENYIFPPVFEQMARPLYILLYVLAIPIASFPDFIKYKNTYEYRALGASGAVSAVIFSAILFRPDMPLQFFFIPFNIPGYVFGILFLITSAYLAKKGQGNIGHNAHFWGAVFGLAFTYFATKYFTGADLMQDFIQLIKEKISGINYKPQ
jgi:membrane associated rhomboid family serine protease